MIAIFARGRDIPEVNTSTLSVLYLHPSTNLEIRRNISQDVYYSIDPIAMMAKLWLRGPDTDSRSFSFFFFSDPRIDFYKFIFTQYETSLVYNTRAWCFCILNRILVVDFYFMLFTYKVECLEAKYRNMSLFKGFWGKRNSLLKNN